jgi:hypothetical protein
MTSSARTQSFHRRFVNTFSQIMVPLLAGWCLAAGAHALAPSPSVAHTTIVIFSDDRIHDEEWTDLFAALRKAKTEFASTMPALAGEVDIVRGDQVSPGLRLDAIVTVFLHGDCTLIPRPHHVVEGALGWVPRSKGIIETFVNVNCTRLVDVLGPLALGMDRSHLDSVMAEAIARVILHEWIHIATQNASHGATGITKPQFGVRDLLAGDVEGRNRLSRKRT